MDDTISRQAALDILDEFADKSIEVVGGSYERARKEMCDLPAAQPEPKTMLFDSRLKLAKNYKEWAEENHVIDCAESVIYYLDIIGLVQPEIIHCNSCKHWTQTTGKMKGYGLGRCDYLNADLVTCNGFCYWAERRNDG